MNMNRDIKSERICIRIFIPSLISSLFKALNALFEIAKRITKNMIKKPARKE